MQYTHSGDGLDHPHILISDYGSAFNSDDVNNIGYHLYKSTCIVWPEI